MDLRLRIRIRIHMFHCNRNRYRRFLSLRRWVTRIRLNGRSRRGTLLHRIHLACSFHRYRSKLQRYNREHRPISLVTRMDSALLVNLCFLRLRNGRLRFPCLRMEFLKDNGRYRVRIHLLHSSNRYKVPCPCHLQTHFLHRHRISRINL
jgi:hypothetical protein